MLTAVRTATRVSNCLSQKWNSLSCLSLKELLDTDYSLSWLGRIAGCLQKEWKGCFPGCQAKAVLSLKGLEVVVGICMGTGKIRATLMITQKKESPWLILLLYVGGLRIAVWWSSFWWFFAQITYCSVAAMVLLPRLLERIGERESARGGKWTFAGETEDIYKDELPTFNATGNRVNGYFLFGKCQARGPRRISPIFSLTRLFFSALQKWCRCVLEGFEHYALCGQPVFVCTS